MVKGRDQAAAWRRLKWLFRVISSGIDRVLKGLTLFFLIDLGLVFYYAFVNGGTVTVGDFPLVLLIEGVLIVLCFFWVLSKNVKKFD